MYCCLQLKCDFFGEQLRCNFFEKSKKIPSKVSLKKYISLKIHSHHYFLETFWLGNDLEHQNSKYFLFHKNSKVYPTSQLIYLPKKRMKILL